MIGVRQQSQEVLTLLEGLPVAHVLPKEDWQALCKRRWTRERGRLEEAVSCIRPL